MSKKKKGDPDTIRGEYKDEKEARGLIRKYRGSMSKIMDIHFNKVSLNFAQRGDIVLAKIQGMTFGIVWGGKAFFKTTNEGFITLPLDQCKYCWRVE